MATTIVQRTVAAAIWARVHAQHGVITRRQLLDFGLSGAAIKHRLATGRLHPVARGVYAAGRRDLTLHGRLMAAVLSCGPAACLSHLSAALLWGLLDRERPLIEISVPQSLRRTRSGIVVHRRASLLVAAKDRIPVTPVAETIVDIAPRLTRNGLEAVVREADKRDYANPDSLRSALDGMPRRPGIRTTRKTLDRRTFRLTDSELERRYLPISNRAGLPRPLTQQVVNGERVDFFYPDLELVVETDGLRYHRTSQQQAKDLRRDQKHLASGLTPLRFTHEQIRYETGYVEATLRQVAKRLTTRR